VKIVFKDSFLNRLANQIRYISHDSPARANKFRTELFAKIKTIPNRPFSFRKSVYFEDENIRDLVFKGYTIVFRITAERIEVFGFVKYQARP
jgi:plasmid stabilization system protein ParE